jgi:CO dehydrogenase maturation factor
MGRGGTGKTSFVALMTKYFIETGDKPLLLIDADPDQSLNEMVGVNLTDIEAISDLYCELMREGGTLAGTTPKERMEGKIWEKGLYEGELFDLLSLGTKWTEGCYCMPNAALKAVIPSLVENYQYALIDSPAGLEHLNRKVTSRVDDIFNVLDSSKKALQHVKRAHRIIEELDIEYEHFYLIGGREFPENLDRKTERETGLKYLGKIAYDDAVREYILKGESLLNLPSDSPAYVSVKKIIEKAGYTSLKQLLFHE